MGTRNKDLFKSIIGSKKVTQEDVLRGLKKNSIDVISLVKSCFGDSPSHFCYFPRLLDDCNVILSCHNLSRLFLNERRDGFYPIQLEDGVRLVYTSSKDLYKECFRLKIGKSKGIISTQKYSEVLNDLNELVAKYKLAFYAVFW